MNGMFAVTTSRNDASPARGQWYLSEHTAIYQKGGAVTILGSERESGKTCTLRDFLRGERF